MKEKQKSCSICGDLFTGWGNSPRPFPGEVCCDDCDDRMVVPVRMILGRDYSNRHILTLLQTIAELGSAMIKVKQESIKMTPIGKLRLIEDAKDRTSDGSEPA